MAVAISSLAHEFRNERIDRRHLVRDADSKAGGEHDDMPDLNPSGEDKKAERECEHDLDDLGRDQDLSFVVTIGGRAAVHGQQKRGNARRRQFTRPSTKPRLVSVLMTQPCAITCIQVPVSEMAEPMM